MPRTNLTERQPAGNGTDANFRILGMKKSPELLEKMILFMSERLKKIAFFCFVK